MIPQVQDDLKQDFTFTTLPSRTFKMRHDTKTITGTIDEVRAVEQAVFLILNVERYEWLIYSWNYGFEKKSLIGKPVDFCIPEIERRVCLSIKKSCKRAPKKRAPSTPNKLVRTAWGEPQRTPFGTLTDHALLQEFWSPFARVGRTKRSRPFVHILEPPSPFSKRTALPVHGLRKTVAFTGENHNMAVVD